MKRENLIELFLRGTKVDAYLAEKVYGTGFDSKVNLSFDNPNILDDSIMN